MSVITKEIVAIEVGEMLTIEFVKHLLTEVRASSMPGKSQLLHDLTKTLDAIKLANRIRRQAPRFQPGTTAFIAANKIFVNTIAEDDEAESID